MSEFKVSGELLTASVDDRTLSFKLLPYGSTGSTNLGKITASKGAITVPENVTGLPVNLEHDYRQPVGKFALIEETDEGLFATVSIARTTAGNDALELAASGLRTGISVEIDSPVIRSGALTAGILSGAGLVVRPAFADAQLVASDFGDLPETPSEPEPVEEENNAEAEAEASTNPEKETDMTENATVPTELQASNNGAVEPQNLRSASALIAQVYGTRDVKLAAALEASGIVGEETLHAALSTITNTALKDTVEHPATWLGELWSGKEYQRKYVPLVMSGNLTSWKVEGFKWNARPTVGDYAGDLADIPSTSVTSTYYSQEASRLAGGVKIDRKFVDFGNSDTIASILRGAATDYALKSDAKVINFIKANSTPVTAGTVPSGVSAAAAKIVDGALAMIDFAQPSFAILGSAAYRDLLLTKEHDSLKYLQSSLGLEGGALAGFTIIPSADVAANDVYVGAREAITFFELGGSPIRVEAIDVSKGGMDEALFGYYALILNDIRGIRKVS
ncbi:hypothetical protein FCN77_16250 [Arthrobacter sp. 24S4-2]|uniref:phage major capsid protein n=1 Tax=Arthrobacter sp. 24S4-2 TaxID=2575374 RepID=UPI0010C7C4FE|nr:hypothetical protein [Arthrobacter sp. 24S4-2]QCO98966.1 hypothetical protein FCN77_16250 [Arthrobacter sp. 24S4-2]